MELRPTRMLNQGRVRPIVVEPIRRHQATQGRIATNSATSRISDTGGTLAPNESEPPAGRRKAPAFHPRVVRVLRRMFKEARRASADQARLRREDQYAILKRAYSALHRWKQEGVSEDAERELRRETECAIAMNFARAYGRERLGRSNFAHDLQTTEAQAPSPLER